MLLTGWKGTAAPRPMAGEPLADRSPPPPFQYHRHLKQQHDSMEATLTAFRHRLQRATATNDVTQVRELLERVDAGSVLLSPLDSVVVSAREYLYAQQRQFQQSREMSPGRSVRWSPAAATPNGRIVNGSWSTAEAPFGLASPPSPHLSGGGASPAPVALSVALKAAVWSLESQEAEHRRFLANQRWESFDAITARAEDDMQVLTVSLRSTLQRRVEEQESMLRHDLQTSLLFSLRQLKFELKEAWAQEAPYWNLRALESDSRRIIAAEAFMVFDLVRQRMAAFTKNEVDFSTRQQRLWALQEQTAALERRLAFGTRRDQESLMMRVATERPFAMQF